MPSEKADLKKALKHLYAPNTTPEIVEVPAMQFLTIDGTGTTESPAFQLAIEALFSVSYKAKFASKKKLGYDYTVMPLEGLWWADDMNDFLSGRKDRWKWTLMIMQPDAITPEIIDGAKDEACRKKDKTAKRTDGAGCTDDINRLRLSRFDEGRAVQMMHIGPFSTEHASIVELHEAIKDAGGTFDGKTGKHHEIYLSDFRKVDPAKMKTILRQPFKLR